MSNNIYNILGKLNSLEPKQPEQKPAQPVYESVEARGSIIAGVKDIEQKLREQYEAAKQVEEGSHFGNEKLANARASRSGTSTVRDQSGKGGVKTTTTKIPSKKDAGAAGDVTKEERETLKTKKGTIYKGGTYGTEYDVGDDGSKKPKAKHVPKKGVKGRPKKEQPTKVDAPKGDIFGRTSGSVPKGKKGTVVKGKAMSHDVNNTKDDDLDEAATNPFAIGMAQAKKEVGLGRAKTHVSKSVEKRGHEIGKAVKKGMNESRDHNSSDYTYETVGRRLATENPHMDTKSDVFFDAVYDECIEIGLTPKAARNLLNYNEDFLSDTASAYAHFAKTVESRGPSFAPQYPSTPAPVAKPSFLDKAKDFGKKAVGATLNTLGHGSDEKLKADLRRDVMGEQDELNELARLAGLQVAESAKPDFTDVDKDGDEKESWKDAEEDKDEEGGKKVDECMSPMGSMAQDMQQAEQQQGRISVNTSADNEGHKNVNISADGEAAEQLMAMLKMAGLGGGEAHAQQAAIVVAQEAKDYGNTDVEEPEEVANSPKPDVRGAHRAETVGFANTSDDLHKQKSQHSDSAAKGDNPLTKKEKAVEDFNPIESLGAKLMAEYQSIKLQK